MAPAAESPAWRGHRTRGWEEQQTKPCLESSTDAAEPCGLRWDKLILSRSGVHSTGALWSIGKQRASALGKGCP